MDSVKNGDSLAVRRKTKLIWREQAISDSLDYLGFLFTSLVVPLKSSLFSFLVANSKSWRASDSNS